MPHRDDHEAARQHIAALERQLTETEARAERDVEEARARAERAEARADARVERAEAKARNAKKKRKGESASASSSPPNWPARQRTRFLRGVQIGVFFIDLPIVAFLAGEPINLDEDRRVWGYAWIPIVASLVWIYGVGRATRAPFPFNAAMTSWLSAALGLFAVLAASSDMFWRDLLAEPPARWLLRGTCGLVAAAFHAFIAAHWAAEAAPSDSTIGD